MGKYTYNPETLTQLIVYVKERKYALEASIKMRGSYSGPDPSSAVAASELSAIETLQGVLDAVRDIEKKLAAQRIDREIGS